MKGTIRVILGLVLTFGAVGTVDVDPNADLIIQTALAVLGLAVMYSGVSAMKAN